MQVLVLGAGQLARMMALAAAPLNIKTIAFDVNSEAIVEPLTQTKLGQGLEFAIEQADVITAEFEHVPHPVLDACQASGKLLPSAEAIKTGGDRRIEKALLDRAQVANAKYALIRNQDDFKAAIEYVGLPMVLKSTLGGYDGKGQWRLTSTQQVETTWLEMEACISAQDSQAIIAEEFVAFDREVSLVGARNSKGEIVVYPLAENVHTNGVLSLSTAIEDKALQGQAKQMFTAVAECLDYVGVLALEFFDVQGKLMVNEIAPRVHNSGHWTQQGAETCQFENHMRAVCGLPLGSTEMLRPTSMINILGEDCLPQTVLAMSQAHVHWYGKDKRPGRKMGHINVSGKDEADRKAQLEAITKLLDPKAYPALSQK
ncbi:5-(carboxyamino)imidazole ribonucleotide synthase [Vibrio gallicus]|uniref:5-(carboxyamino)imidazole ribonucleotide synthase n=1 Tax=Vibrio gallicus TaxID=190897 RepID=UPI0021C454ED|nr:5-(carboxyamino)imidazole ribonucleotide synthase [Vibrio gallicus]